MTRTIWILLLFASMICSGCWDTREITDLALITAMGIDKEKDQYVLTTQVVNPAMIASQQRSGDQSSVFTYQTKGKTISEALHRRMTMGSRENYTPTLKILVIGEKLAREGIDDLMDYFSRNREIESTFFIVVAKRTTAANILDVMTPLEKNPADMIYSSIKTQLETKPTIISTTTDDLLKNLIDDGEEAKLTGIEIVGKKEKSGSEENVKKLSPATLLKINTISVFYKDKLIGWLSEDASKGLNLILNKVKTMSLIVPCPGNTNKKISMKVEHSSTSVKGLVYKHQPKVLVKIRSELNLDEVQCKNIQIKDPKTLNELNILAQKEIQRLIKIAIYFAQKKYKTDVLEFGHAIHRKDADFWKENSKNWDKLFTHLPSKIQSEVHITFTGTVTDTMLRKIKE